MILVMKVKIILLVILSVFFLSFSWPAMAVGDCQEQNGRCADFENPSCSYGIIGGNFQECAYHDDEGNITGYWNCCKTTVTTPSPDQLCRNQNNQNGYCLQEGNTCPEGEEEIEGNFEDCRVYSTYFKCCNKRKSTDFSCNNNSGVVTALGCIPTNDMNSFAGWLLSKAILIAGGIAFILMSIGVFQITTSAGDPKKVQAGSELITSTLSGLLFIILSIFLLKLIGVDVLHLPGL